MPPLGLFVGRCLLSRRRMRRRLRHRARATVGLSGAADCAWPGVDCGTCRAERHRQFRILIFPPQSDKVAREFSIPLRPTSLAFARRDRLFYGANGGHDEFFVRELNVASGERVRSIDLRPSWYASSVATDDNNVLYVNTKSFVGGDVKLFQPGDRSPISRSRIR